MLRPGPSWLVRTPPDMQLSIENHAQPLKMLLFIRHAWSVTEELNLPKLFPLPDTGSSALPDTESKQIWDERWTKEWNKTWEWYDSRGNQVGPISQEDMISISRPGQPPHPFVPPFWETEYGSVGIDRDAFMTWDRLTTIITPHPYPKRTLVDAWKAGVRSIIILPYAGYFAERRKTSLLVVSEDAMRDPSLFLNASI